MQQGTQAMTTPEEEARELIDQQLAQAGWQVQDYADMNLYAQSGVAVREFPLALRDTSPPCESV